MRRPRRWTNERIAVACLTALAGALLVWVLMQPGPIPSACIPMAGAVAVGLWFSATGRLPERVERHPYAGGLNSGITRPGDAKNVPMWWGLIALIALALFAFVMWLIF